MEKKFKLKYPIQQNFIVVEGFDKTIPIEDLIEEEFLQYAEECKQEFIKHYYSKCKNTKNEVFRYFNELTVL